MRNRLGRSARGNQSRIGPTGILPFVRSAIAIRLRMISPIAGGLSCHFLSTLLGWPCFSQASLGAGDGRLRGIRGHRVPGSWRHRHHDGGLAHSRQGSAPLTLQGSAAERVCSTSRSADSERVAAGERFRRRYPQNGHHLSRQRGLPTATIQRTRKLLLSYQSRRIRRRTPECRCVCRTAAWRRTADSIQQGHQGFPRCAAFFPSSRLVCRRTATACSSAPKGEACAAPCRLQHVSGLSGFFEVGRVTGDDEQALRVVSTVLRTVSMIAD